MIEDEHALIVANRLKDKIAADARDAEMASERRVISIPPGRIRQRQNNLPTRRIIPCTLNKHTRRRPSQGLSSAMHGWPFLLGHRCLLLASSVAPAAHLRGHGSRRQTVRKRLSGAGVRWQLSSRCRLDCSRLSCRSHSDSARLRDHLDLRCSSRIRSRNHVGRYSFPSSVKAWTSDRRLHWRCDGYRILDGIISGTCGLVS
jgi:hypothetical protein